VRENDCPSTTPAIFYDFFNPMLCRVDAKWLLPLHAKQFMPNYVSLEG
jgi:hypothetical protein